MVREEGGGRREEEREGTGATHLSSPVQPPKEGRWRQGQAGGQAGGQGGTSVGGGAANVSLCVCQVSSNETNIKYLAVFFTS